MRTVNIVYTLVCWLGIIKETQKQNIKLFFENVAPAWVQAFVALLAVPDEPNGDYGIKIAILRVDTFVVLF